MSINAYTQMEDLAQQISISQSSRIGNGEEEDDDDHISELLVVSTYRRMGMCVDVGKDA